MNLNIILENLSVDYFSIQGLCPQDSEDLKISLNNIIFSFKNVDLYNINHTMRNKNNHQCALQTGSDFKKLLYPLRWKYILDNAAHFSVKGEVNFDRNEEINYDISEMFYKHFLGKNMLRSTDEAHRNLLEKYRRLSGTTLTNKITLFLSRCLSNHRTNILLPIGYMVGLVAALMVITYWSGDNYMFLLFPGSAILLYSNDALVELSGLLFTLVWIEQVILAGSIL